MRTEPQRWRRAQTVALPVALSVAAVLLASCGLPGEGDVERVSDGDVPYDLLESAAASPGGDDGDPAAAPRVFWLEDDQLVAHTAATSCREDPAVVVALVLDELAAGPRDDARAAGLFTAIPPESTLALVEIEGGTATVEVDPETEISPVRLPAAVGQIVLTVTSAPGVESVVIVSDGTTVPVPLPGGALADGPVTADDYADLRPRDRTSQTAGCPER